MNKGFIFIAISFFLGLSTGLALTSRADRREPGPQQFLATDPPAAAWPVTGATDGDTLEIMWMPTEPQPEKVRIAGIECPEKSTARGKVARQYLRDLVDGREIILEFENPEKKRGAYGRLLAHTYIQTATGQVDIGRAMILNAGCYVYKGYDGPKLREYLAAECTMFRCSSCDF